MTQNNINHTSSANFLGGLVSVVLKNLVKLVKNFPANFFLVVFFIALGFAIYYNIEYWAAYTKWKQMSSYENWYGLSVLSLNIAMMYSYAIAGASLFWAFLLRNSSIKDIIKKEISLTKKTFTSLGLFSMIVIIFYATIFSYEYIFPEARYYISNGISISEQFKNFKPCVGMEYLDYEGKRYSTIQIGSQCWIKENINIGERIDLKDGINIIDDKIQKYCTNDNEANCTVDGGQYNLLEAMKYELREGSQGICPNNWHIPITEEVKYLDMYLECGRQGDSKCANMMHKKLKNSNFIGEDLNFLSSTKEQPTFHEENNNWDVQNKFPVKCIMNKLDDKLIEKEERMVTLSSKIDIEERLVTDAFYNKMIELYWNNVSIPYLIILKEKGKSPDLADAKVFYYGGSNRHSLIFRPEDDSNNCFSIYGIDNNFKVIKEQTDTVCFSVDYDTFFKEADNSLYESALSTEKDSFCDHIIDADLRDTCYINIADKAQSLVPCDKCTNSFKYICYSMIAAIKNDLSICDGIIDIGYKNYCYDEVASSSKEISICKKITVPSQRDNCYYNYASTNNDASACNKMVSDINKNDCISNARKKRN